MKRKLHFLIVAASLLLIVAVTLQIQVQTAKALVPSIVSVNTYVVGTSRWVNVTVNHTPPPAIGASHYVSNVQIEVNGTAVDLSQSPQTTETFSVQYNLGPNTNAYSVRARAFCVVHGYSAFSNAITIPEFTTTAFLLMTLLAGVMVLMARKMPAAIQQPTQS